MTNTTTRTETMVERVARAISEHFSAAERAHGTHIEAALAAIEAMRDLPDAMKWCHEMPDIGPDEITELWQAMIDQILGEGK